MFNREVGRRWNDDATLPNISFGSQKTYALVQCLHSVELQRYQVGETSHLLVKHRISGNTKLNFDT